MIQRTCILVVLFMFAFMFSQAQTQQDSTNIKKAALGYLESQHNVNAAQMKNAIHPRMVKRTVWLDKYAQKEYLRETFSENMIYLAETYNVSGERFPKNPKKEVVFFDVAEKVASVKVIADDWIDYMHLAKINDEWKIINVAWQFNDTKKHQ